jgi:S-formylglutathione hydrolase FrmB
VLYLFRGHQGEWLGKNQDSSRGGRNVIDVYEEQLAAAIVGPMILVFPGISSEDNVVSGMATNFLAPGLTGASGVGTGRFEDYLMQEVIPYVDGHFRTIAHRTGRGVDGFSLGGFMSTKVASQHPERFRTVGSFDGTFMYADPTCQYIDPSDTVFTNSMFDPVYGAPLVTGGPRSLESSAYAARNNAANLICNSTAEQMQSLAWFVQYGPLSKEPLDANYRRGEHLVQKLRDKGVANAFADPVLDGGHKWAVADEHMRQTLPLHWGVLRASTALECGVNFASAAAGATASASSVYSSRSYSPAGVIDGERAGANWEQGGGWNDATRGLWPDWLQVSFSGAKTINQIRVYTLQDNFGSPTEPTSDVAATLYGLLDFDVQYWDGARWATVPGGSVTGNDRAMRVFDFPELTTTKIRVVVGRAREHFSRITEVEAVGCAQP